MEKCGLLRIKSQLLPFLLMVLLLPQFTIAISVDVVGEAPGREKASPYRDMSYSYAATDFSTANGTHIKTITVIKNLGVPETRHQHHQSVTTDEHMLRPVFEDLSADISRPKVRNQDLKVIFKVPEYVPISLTPREFSTSSQTFSSPRRIFSDEFMDFPKVDNAPQASFQDFPARIHAHFEPSEAKHFTRSPISSPSTGQTHPTPSTVPPQTTTVNSVYPVRSVRYRPRGRKHFLEDFSGTSPPSELKNTVSTEKIILLEQESLPESVSSTSSGPAEAPAETSAFPDNPESTSEASSAAPRIRAYIVGGIRRIK
ncbi:hypothetical protein DMENIID0001_049520 [Sergentomyia squamirostris]